jgi:predicted flap endonuclease-1-like 5' DNA nuclease
MCILCILIPILLGLLCALLGYLLGRYLEKKSKVYSKLRADLDACRKENEELLTLNSSLKSEIAGLKDSGSSKPLVFNSALAAGVFRKKIVENDLKLIEGIGPKIAELFHNAGIKTWKALAETSVERCQQILDAAGDRYKVHQPGSWPKQSKMAYLGQWNELKEWQDKVAGGKE